jgi:hypothetical protein
MPTGSAAKNASTVSRARPSRPRRMTAASSPARKRGARKPTAQKRTRVERITRSVKSAAESLRSVDAESLTESVRSFARSRPLWFLGGAFVTGVALARLFKAAPPPQLSSALDRRADPTDKTMHQVMREV